MARFWYEHPILELAQRYGTLQYGMYPNAKLYSWLHSFSVDHQKKILSEKLYTLDSVEEIREWCATNCSGDMVYSERYGSFTFELERDRVLMKLFFPDDSFCEPKVLMPTHPSDEMKILSNLFSVVHQARIAVWLIQLSHYLRWL